ncbi:kinase [Clostridium botulinum]|uniref:carbohydrate kinase family protein n=1 Tax=Clostridium botulinum TaxID=1491 RepID=UPI00077389D2|nr:carbohydrate kinase family protein [Clostridium botulinum]APH20720.1 phosphomethylpyrimidine kinase family protein [Clostridium botulinum]AUM91354.1 kinase [Clostridium botulinum]NFB15509.1 kinase [Clostridium botulinum]NFH60271.1 kinase [Clostridium botulinum]NFH63768.1 kinase [Clostridium botulinum]
MNYYCNNEPYVLVFGASVVDIFGFSCCDYRAYNSNPGKIKISFGGVCRNIAENLSRVGINTKFISILGEDENAKCMLEHSRKMGYDMGDSLILKGGTTPTYMAILDENGEMVSAVADMKSIGEMNSEFIDSKADIIKKAEYTVLDSDNPEILEYILKKFKGKTKFILDPVSAEKAKNIKPLIKYFHTIKPNIHEAEVLSGFRIETIEDLKKAGEYFESLGVKNVFISLDAEGIYYKNKFEEGRIKAKDVTVKNVTGAGDAFVAGIAYGYMNKLSLEETVKFAITMANLTIAHENTINPDLSYNIVGNNIKNIQWIEEYL